MQELGLVGGVLRRDGQIVAFSIGERLNSETFVVHFEKAYPDLQGAYPMINQQFVLHECEGYAYVNREEDTGDPGLRKAKLIRIFSFQNTNWRRAGWSMRTPSGMHRIFRKSGRNVLATRKIIFSFI